MPVESQIRHQRLQFAVLFAQLAQFPKFVQPHSRVTPLPAVKRLRRYAHLPANFGYLPAGFDLPQFLARLHPHPAIAVRHTVGLADPIVTADQHPADRIGDGLPETLEEVVRRYAPRYYKLKVGGAIDTDLERLTRIAAVLDREAGDYRVTLDGNEQYDCAEAVAELWRRMRERPALARLAAATVRRQAPVADRPLAADAAVVEEAQVREPRPRARPAPGGGPALRLG